MTTNDIKNVAVIGGGLMGCGIAQVFALSGEYEVTVYDKFATGADIKERVGKNLEVFVAHGIYDEAKVAEIQEKIMFKSDLKEAVEDVQLIIECVPENMELKQNLMAELEDYCSEDTIFATNTSVMSITEIASKAKIKERIVGTHFWNPPYLIPLVEVVKAEHTQDSVVDTTMEVLAKVGKHPIRVAKDVPGFVANRLQHALWREAISIVENGIADAKTVDDAIKMSFGMRLPVLAPLENADMVGTDLTLSIHSYIFKYLENSTEASQLLKEKVATGDLGFKSGNGFQEWTPETIEASRTQLTEHLIKVLYGK